MLISRSSLAASSLLVVVLAAGCSAGVTTGQQTSPPSSTAPSAPASQSSGPQQDPTATSSDPGSGSSSSVTSGESAKLPSEFPVPDGAKVTMVAKQSDEIAATMIVADGGKALDFWRTKLPEAGFKVTHTDSIGGLGEIRFSGHGCVANSQIAVTDGTVAVQCDLR